MENVSKADIAEAKRSLLSAVRKSEKALAQMSQKGASTTVIEKRLTTLRVGLAVLDNVWSANANHYTKDDLVEARSTLSGLLLSVQDSYAKSRVRSPQRTLLERRLRALELAVQGIDYLSSV